MLNWCQAGNPVQLGSPFPFPPRAFALYSMMPHARGNAVPAALGGTLFSDCAFNATQEIMSSAFYPEDFSQDMISQQSPALFLEPSAKNLPRYATACAGAVYLMSALLSDSNQCAARVVAEEKVCRRDPCGKRSY